MQTLIKFLIAVALPALTYWSTRAMPFGQVNAITTLNNFCWMASALYFVGYLPLKGLRLKHWIPKIVAALLAISLFLTGWQAAARYRKAEWDAIRQGQPTQQQSTQTPQKDPVTKTRATELVMEQPDVKTLQQKLGAKFVVLPAKETDTEYIIEVGENQKVALTYWVSKADGTVTKQ
jgi:flagellar biosynthesis component FlhA